MREMVALSQKFILFRRRVGFLPLLRLFRLSANDAVETVIAVDLVLGLAGVNVLLFLLLLRSRFTHQLSLRFVTPGPGLTLELELCGDLLATLAQRKWC
jgi:hypothetical protein